MSKLEVYEGATVHIRLRRGSRRVSITFISIIAMLYHLGSLTPSPNHLMTNSRYQSIVEHSSSPSPPLLQNGIDEKSTSFVASAINMTFTLPSDRTYISQMQANKGGAKYLRDATEITKRGSKGNCSSMMMVLAFIMGEVNKANGTMMVAYGELIHLYREKDFVVHEEGVSVSDRRSYSYMDDDFDTFASIGTVTFLGSLEQELFNQFGWTMRVLISGQYLRFMQIFASCGHALEYGPRKIKSDEPAIEVYPLAPINPVEKDGKMISVVKDLWPGGVYSESMIFPSHHISFNTAALSHPLMLQVPNKPFDFLTCVYGEWGKKSPLHAKTNNKLCLDLENNTWPVI